MEHEFILKGKSGFNKKQLVKYEKVLGQSACKMVSIKVRPLTLSKKGYVQKVVSPAYYQKLFKEWLSYNKAKKIKAISDALIIKMSLENDERFKDLIGMVVKHEDGPEIILNSNKRNDLELNLPEVVEYVSEFIETLVKDDKKQCIAFIR